MGRPELMAKYKQLAEQIITDIRAEKLTVGSRMLSLRRFAKQHKVSISTAVSCYQELEKREWLQARPQSGYFITQPLSTLSVPTWKGFSTKVVTPSSKPEQSTPVSLPSRTPCDFRIDDGPLGASNMELEQTSIKALERSHKRVLNQSHQRLSQYPHRQGEPLLRQAIAHHFSNVGFAMGADELVITTGCLEAVKTALLVCTKPGDVVAVNSPCFNELLDLLTLLEIKLIEIPTQSDGIDLNRLERLMRAGKVQAGLFSTTHMNPQGITLSLEQKKRLSQLANQYRLPIIEDDVYLELNHVGQLHLPASYYDKNGYLLWCGSFSKSLSPSYRLGWCKAGRYLDKYLQLSQGAPIYTQLAIADFIRSGNYDKHLKKAKYQLAENKQTYIRYLNQQLPDGSRITQPDGGLVLWIQVPKLDAKLLGQKALQADIDIRTGDIFTFSNRHQDCFRINIGYKFSDKIQQELDSLTLLVKQSSQPSTS